MLKSKYQKLLIIGYIFLGVIASGTIIFFVAESRIKKLPSTVIAVPTQVPVPKKVSDLLATVSKQIQLPQGETPSVATVHDVNKLPKELFFANAQNGDKVLIYASAGKAYLFRPSTGEIIQESSVEIMSRYASDASKSAELATPSGQLTPILRIQY